MRSSPRFARLRSAQARMWSRGEDLPDRTSRPSGPGQVLGRHLGGHVDRLGALAHHLADHALAAAVAVGERGVDEVEPEVDRAVERLDRLVVVRRLPTGSRRSPRRRIRSPTPRCRCCRACGTPRPQIAPGPGSHERDRRAEPGLLRRGRDAATGLDGVARGRRAMTPSAAAGAARSADTEGDAPEARRPARVGGDLRAVRRLHHLEDQLAHPEEGLAARAAGGVALAQAAQVEAGALEHGRACGRGRG